MRNMLSYKKYLSLILAGAVLLAILGPVSAVAAQSTCGATYTVKPGDYLTKIARTCGVSYSDLLKANPKILYPSLIYTGQVLNIPGSVIPVTGGSPSVYTVQKGDTLYSIGLHYSLTVAELREANTNLGSTLYAGQVLNIPARIRFATGGTSVTLQGHLGANAKQYYLLAAGAGQTLEVTLSAPSALTLAIYGADGSTVDEPQQQPRFPRCLAENPGLYPGAGIRQQRDGFQHEPEYPAAHSLCRGQHLSHPNGNGSG